MARGAAALAALAAVALLAGCGVAGETGVVRDEPGKPYGAFGGGDEPKQAPTRLAAGKNPVAMVENFLTAAAGEPGHAVDRLRAFLAPDQANKWQPDDTVIVVHQLGDVIKGPSTGDTWETSVELQPVGAFNPDTGTVDPLPSQPSKTVSMVVRPDEPAGGAGLYVANPPPAIYLLDTALTTYYKPNPIYFWAKNYRALVPDLRYLPLYLPEQERPGVVVQWLIGGPSPWLLPAVDPLPRFTTVLGNVGRDGNRLVVNLSVQASQVDPRHLSAQLRWSLWDRVPGPIRLQVAGQTRRDDEAREAHLAENATVALPDDPAWFCVAGGVVLERCQQVPAEQRPPALPAEQNQQVVSAAILRDESLVRVALVKRSGDRFALWVGRKRPEDKKAQYNQAISGRQISRPVWLRASSPTGLALVAIDGGLRQVEGDGSTQQLDVRTMADNTALGRITAVAAAPDAGRIALIASGQVYVAALKVEDGQVTVGPARLLHSILIQLTGVAFSAQERILVAGKFRSQSQLYSMALDGTNEQAVTENLGSAEVTRLVAYPEDPISHDAPPPMIELDGKASRAYSESLEYIKRQLVGPGPSTPPASVAVTAPFYQD